MALVARQVECPLPCPSPVRVGSRGTIHYLMGKERHSDSHTSAYRSKTARELANVCREVVSVSCGQPLLSYKPKRYKTARKVPENRAVQVQEKARPSNKGVSFSEKEIIPDSLLRRATLPKNNASRAMVGVRGVVRRSYSHGDAYDFERSSLEERNCMAANGLNRCVSQKGAMEDYNKALIPFLRSELDSKSLRRRQSTSVPVRNFHLRATSLGNAPLNNNLLCKDGISTISDQKVWDSCTSPSLGSSRRHTFLRLDSGDT